MRQQSVELHLVCMCVSVCLYMHSCFFLGMCACVCERSIMFICARAEASSALWCFCPSGSESLLEELVPNGWGNNVDVPPRAIWWPAELTPSLQSWSTALGNSHTAEPPPLPSNQQSFTSKSCYLHRVGMSPRAWLRKTEMDR